LEQREGLLLTKEEGEEEELFLLRLPDRIGVEMHRELALFISLLAALISRCLLLPPSIDSIIIMYYTPVSLFTIKPFDSLFTSIGPIE
jgi:hypothetical protein